MELPEVQADLTNLNASGELHKLRDTCADAGIEYKALKAAARKPFAIAQDMADGWIREYHIKTDSRTKVLYYYQDGVYVNGEDFISGLIDNKFRGINTSTFIGNVLGYIRRKSIYEFNDEWLVVNNGVINPRTLEIVWIQP